jgi:hypothetical protein
MGKICRYALAPDAPFLHRAAMSEQGHFPLTSPAAARPWDARLARRLVTPLKDTWVTPNYLTTVRLFVGLAAAAAFVPKAAPSGSRAEGSRCSAGNEAVEAGCLATGGGTHGSGFDRGIGVDRVLRA